MATKEQLLEQLKSNISKEHLSEIENMSDKQLVDTWKIYISKSKRIKSKHKDFIKYESIAKYALYLHNLNRQREIEESLNEN